MNRICSYQGLTASLLLFVILLYSFSEANAGSQPQTPDYSNRPRLNFSLFSVRGSDQVELKKLPEKMTIVNFWRADCPPCVKELPMLIKVSEKLNIRLITIAVQGYSETKNFWPHVPGDPKKHIALLGPTNPNGVLRRFGNKTGAIPHTVLLNKRRQACNIRTGEITEKWLRDRVQPCEDSVPIGKQKAK